jgi:nucleoside 2-deoxyribosyltransferase
MMRVFIAGVMQGSRRDQGIAAQDYREQIAEVLEAHLPDVEIVDPNQIHPDGVSYDRQRAKQTLIEMAELAGAVDCLVAYVPEASMGTAVEMWHAHQVGIPVYTISPMEHNWIIFTLSDQVFPDLASFGEFVASGGVRPL